MDGVDNAVEVIGEEEAVWAGAEESAGTAFGDGLAGFGDEEAGEEVFGLAAGGSEADDAVAGADLRVARAVKGDDEGVFEDGVRCVEVFEAQQLSGQRLIV